MTILKDYAPEEFNLTSTREYNFTFPAVDNDSIEVYEIILADGTEYQYLVPIQDYKLEWKISNTRYPLLTNGKVSFSRKHSVGTQRVMILRNTLIDQTVDFPPYSSFNSRMVEFALDKHTMICQEIAQRKCDVAVSARITQEIIYSAYDEFSARLVNFSVQKIFDILHEIDNTGLDCTAALDQT